MDFTFTMFYALLAHNARRLDDFLPAPRVSFAAAILVLASSLGATAEGTELTQRRLGNTFPTPEDTEPLAASHPQLPADASAAAIDLPAGFTASVFAAEPDVQNPIDVAWDGRGRMWVAENFTYAKRDVRFRDDLRDRVVVFTDADCDGTPEQRTVFMDTLSRLTSVEVGPGPGGVSGVWLMCPPQLLFIPDADHDLIPDGPPHVILDGFEVAEQNYHNFANGLRFGPDGWLYGRCGGSCPGRIGVPGTADEQRTALEGGVWRYDVRQRRFEVICHGTTNPWGHDFNQYGDLFFSNTVNGHLWHGIHGAHFSRPFTLDPNPSVYATIDQHADHYHFDTGQPWTESRDGAANDFGGGHAHCGLMIYQESSWPASYRNALMTLNFHGRRANRENLLRRGTGYVATHGIDFFLSGDEWFRGMELSAGPDGNVFVLDWSDLGECHEHTGVHRSSGRIYKITANSGDRATPSRITDDIPTLVQWVMGDRRWFSHQAMMRLRELQANGSDLSSAIELLQSHARQQPDPACRCRLLWALDVLGGLDDYEFWFADPSEYVRAAAIRSYVQHWPIDDVFGPTADGRAAWPRIADPARRLVGSMGELGAGASPLVRLNLASTLQRIPASMRTGAAIELLRLSGDQDIGDHNLAKLLWFGLMDRAATTPLEMVDVLKVCELPELTKYLSRSIAEQVASSPHAFSQLQLVALEKYQEYEFDAIQPWCNAMFTGVEQGLVGVRRASPAPAWPALREAILANTPARRPLCEQIDTLYGDGMSVQQLRIALDDSDADAVDRLAALRGLVAAWRENEFEGPAAAAMLTTAARPLIADPHVNMAAAELLAQIEHPETAQVLLDHYGRFRVPLRGNVISLLCAREIFASALIEKLEQGSLPKEILSASHVRSIAALGNIDLVKRVEAIWGRVRETAENRQHEIDRLKKVLTPERLRSANLQAGRALFDRTCATCHCMFGNGERVGPDLTGSQRSSLDYLLSNIVDPDSVVGADYRATKVLTVDGRLLIGLVTQRTRGTMTIASAAKTETIRLDDIEEEVTTDQSPMPSGLLQPLSDEQIVDLIGYLQSPTQVVRGP